MNNTGDSEKPPSMEDQEPSSEKPPSCKSLSWKWQLRNRITVEHLRKREIPISDAVAKFPFSATPYYWSLIREYNSSDPIFRMCVPSDEELQEGLSDPLCEEEQSPVDCLIHRYGDRALVVSTSICSTYCRYCTRKRTVGMRDRQLTDKQLKNIVVYLKEHPEITDVIVSGGDPLVMETRRLERILKSIREVSSVQIIRIGTKVPVVLPQRVDDELVEMLCKYHPLFVNTHFNHPNEITPESKLACEMLVNHGVPVGNQSVLLKGVNDNKLVYEELCRKLIAMRVRPYYLYQCDLVQGAEHFRTKVSQGIEIMEHLRGRISGMAIPQFVIDSPGGKGKIPILPTYMISQSPDKVVLRNYKGEIAEYPEPR
jgi:lysine 2,3-aminomutase